MAQSVHRVEAERGALGTVRVAGAEAALQGVARAENPYGLDARERYAWFAGYDAAAYAVLAASAKLRRAIDEALRALKSREGTDGT